MKTKKRYLSHFSIIGLFIFFFYISSCDSKNKEIGSTAKNPPEQAEKDDKTINPIEKVQNEPTVRVLEGEIGLSQQWGSGWLDLYKSLNFQKGDSLNIIVGGTADRIVLRLLSEGKDPNSPSGIVGRIHQVPNSGEVQVKLSRDYQNVIQLSVHGGENPWGVYPLGAGNGAAIIQNVTLIR